MSAPRPFRLDIPAARLADLQERLGRVAWPDEPPATPGSDARDEAWAAGPALGWMQDLVGYWRDGFDWRAAEREFNRFPQFTVPLDGIDLHYLHVPGVGPAPMPLLLVHGWPSSTLDFVRLIPLLTDPAAHGGDPADAFTVVAPSLPGYPLSHRDGQPRCDLPAMVAILARLMTDVLGYRRFGAHGGDWGAILTAMLAQDAPDLLAGLHLTMLPGRRVPDPATPEEAEHARELARWTRDDAAYQAIQGTRPQTLAFALQDSPVGLAAWMVEKFRAWSDERDGAGLTREQMLATITLYWVTGAIGASFWPYRALRQRSWPFTAERPVRVPTGYAAFPREILRPPRSIAARTFTDIRSWSVMPRGGHFAALEQPELLAADLRQFYRTLRPAQSA